MTIKRTLFLMICTVSGINAMEVEKKICYLADLPTEIHNHIASYLTFDAIESDDELIDRTRRYGAISPEHSDLLKQEKKVSGEYSAIKSVIPTLRPVGDTPRAYSIDCSKIISLEKLSNKPKVTIFDIQKRTKKESAKLTELSQKNIDAIKHIAVSRTGSCYATLCSLKNCRADEQGVMVISYANYLFINNLLFHEEQQLPIPGHYCDFTSIGFNKQGTKIIVHVNEKGCWGGSITETDKPAHFHIIALTCPEEHKAKSERTLEVYLRSIGCCNDLANSLEEQSDAKNS